eukprot:3866248-Pyramimonas_sp.AAC.1
MEINRHATVACSSLAILKASVAIARSVLLYEWAVDDLGGETRSSHVGQTPGLGASCHEPQLDRPMRFGNPAKIRTA